MQEISSEPQPDPEPLGQDDFLWPRLKRILANHFDEAFYRACNTDILEDAIDPIAHYLKHGARALLDPSPAFSTRYYLHRYPDLRTSGLNPLLHYAFYGKREGRRGLPPGFASASELSAMVALVEPAFDSQYYLEDNPDVAEAGMDPVLHYLEHGTVEGRDPTPAFSTAYYLETNPDVAEAGINPYYHYLVQGRGEGRRPSPSRHDRTIVKLRDLPSLEEQVRAWQRHDIPPRSLKTPALLDALEAAGICPNLLVSLTHDDYRKVIGGVQLCVGREEVAARAAGFSFLNLHPWQPLPRLARAGEDPLLVVRLDGHLIGAARGTDILEAFATLATSAERMAIAIHALLGHSAELVGQLARLANPGLAFWWLHDHFSICPGHTLLRNTVSPCGAPPVGSLACQICIFGEERLEHLHRIDALFRAVRFTVVAPSEGTLAFWQEKTDLPATRVSVRPHCEIAPATCDAASPAHPDPNEPVRVAFVGLPTDHKGWPIFEALVAHERANPDYRFEYFGEGVIANQGIARTPVRVGHSDYQAMARALHRAAIDLVVIWSSAPETFSLTAHEALAAGAAILCPPESGNVARLVEHTGKGKILESEAALMAFFATGEAARLGHSLRSSRGPLRELRFATGTLKLIEEALQP